MVWNENTGQVLMQKNLTLTGTDLDTNELQPMASRIGFTAEDSEVILLYHYDEDSLMEVHTFDV